MRTLNGAGLVGLLQVLLACPPAVAMQFSPVQIAADEMILGGRGPIVSGDTHRLERALAAVPRSTRLIGLALDSPGGNVLEGEQLARLIHNAGLPVIIPSNSQCASACFLLFAAAPRRLAANDALVGVHSANENGEETETSMAVTTAMARDAAQLGVPPAIIGKMVVTTPGRVAWLTPGDLASMGVELYDGDTQTAVNQPATASNRPITLPTPAAPSPPAAPPRSSDFEAGRADRRGLTIWLGSVEGAYRDGALAALAQHDRGEPATCTDAGGASRGDFTQGCQAAWQRLALADGRAHASPAYETGWKAGTDVPRQASPAAEAEFHGAFFCGHQAARLTLLVFAVPDGTRRRATFSFGPLPSSPQMPQGSFIVQGLIDLRGGTIDMAPVSWVVHPPGFSLLGLSGRSDDGGKTFTGHVTASTACTLFTLRRAG